MDRMPLQTPQWTEVLSCQVCFQDFSPSGRQPVSLSCGHTACRLCLSKLHRQQCPFDQTAISKDVSRLPTNFAILQLVAGPDVMRDPARDRIPDGMKPADFESYHAAQRLIEELALYLKPLSKAVPNGVNGTSSGSSSGSLNGSGPSQLLSRPIQRKLVTLVSCQLLEEEGRARAVRAARSLGERVVTELIIQHQNPQQLSTNLWAAVRARGCQFLGPAMQEETLKLVLLALEDGTPLSRKVLVMFVVQKLEEQFPQASKTSVGHVVQLLYRASCFKVTKREEESSLMQLKEEFRNYDSLRREHDAQIVQIAIEAGLRISPEQWSSLLYGDLNHKSHMQSIIDKLQTPASFASSIQELTICLQRSGDPVRLNQLHPHLEKLAAIDPSPGAMSSSWEKIKSAVDGVKKVLQGLVDFMQNYSQNKKALDLQTQNIKYKTSLCRDIMQKGGCPRGPSCTFAHTEDELERYRCKSRQLLSILNNQSKTGKPGHGESLPAENPKDPPQRTASMPVSALGDSRGDSDLGYLGDITNSWAGSDLRFGSTSGTGSSSLEGRSHSSGGYKSESGKIHRMGPMGDAQLQEHGVMEDEHALASLYGLSEALVKGTVPNASRGGLDSPTPDSPRSSNLTARAPGPAPGSAPISSARLYLANRSMSRTESEQPLTDSERSSSGSLSSLQPKVQGLPQDIKMDQRYAVPADDGYYLDRHMGSPSPSYPPPPNEVMPVKPPMSDRTLQPRILVPTAPRPKPDAYHDQKGAQQDYTYLTPLGGRYLYPDPLSAPSPRPTVYRRPAVQRYVDPHTMKAYDVVPADDYSEPSAPPHSLLPSQDYHMQRQHPREPMYRETSEYYPHYKQQQQQQPVNGTSNHLRQPPPVGTPILVPVQGQMSNSQDPTPIGRPSKTEVQPPQPPFEAPLPKHPLKVEQGPSLVQLKERQDYLVNVLDEIKDDSDTKRDWDSVQRFELSNNKLSEAIMSTLNSCSSYSSSMWHDSSSPEPSKLQVSGSSLWDTKPISSPCTTGALNFHCKPVDDDEDIDIDHSKNGIDVDEEEEPSKTIPENNIYDHDGQDERLDSDLYSQGSYNPWTSTALFIPNTGRVKETPTNYTMTYSKVLVRHVSANEDEVAQTPSLGSHDMHDFESMSMADLQRTLNKVEQQDKRAGSSHHERTTKIQMEMGRRQDDPADVPPMPFTPPVSTSPPSSSLSVSSTPSTNPLPSQLVHKAPIYHLYTKYSDARVRPGIPHKDKSKGPVSGMARVIGCQTGPLKVSAGKVENTMPVNMTVQDCQVAPGFQNPDGEGYYIKTAEDKHTRGLNSCVALHQEDWEKKVDRMVEKDPRAEHMIKQALEEVRDQIHARENVRHARNTFMLDLEEKALENMTDVTHPPHDPHHQSAPANGHPGKGHPPPPKGHSAPVKGHSAPVKGHAAPVKGHQAPAKGHTDPQSMTSASSFPETRAAQMQESVISHYAKQAPQGQAPQYAYPPREAGGVPQRDFPKQASHAQGQAAPYAYPPREAGAMPHRDFPGQAPQAQGQVAPYAYPPREAGAAAPRGFSNQVPQAHGQVAQYPYPPRETGAVPQRDFPRRQEYPVEYYRERQSGYSHQMMPVGSRAADGYPAAPLSCDDRRRDVPVMENDQKIAEELQRMEQEEYMRHLEQVQRMETIKQQRRLQEERDRRMAKDLALREAMSRGYNQYP